jgi:hypothetical protein
MQSPASSSSHQGPGGDRRLAGYLAAVGAAAGSAAASADAAIVGSTMEMPFGVNGEANIDFNADGQIDFQIDHDRVNVGGNDLDFLQIDKNDVNGASNPLAFDPLPGFKPTTFPPGATAPNNGSDAGYMVPAGQGDYPAALAAGTPIGPGAKWDWQEGDNFFGTGRAIRANRLIDEDATQIDQILGGRTAAQVQVPTNGPNFLGLGGSVRYLGVRTDLNGTGQLNYGWIGIRIDNQADATGAVVGYGYQTVPGTPINAGAVPEPGTTLLAAAGLAAAFAFRRASGRNRR